MKISSKMISPKQSLIKGNAPLCEASQPFADLAVGVFKRVKQKIVTPARLWLVALFLWFPLLLSAQFYPIQLTVFSDGMFSGSLNEMAGGSVGNFKALLSFNDITSPKRDVYLKVAIGGNLNSVSRPLNDLPSDMIFSISGGETLMLEGVQFSRYFDPTYQLSLSQITSAKVLQAGTYRLTVEVYDALSLKKISNTVYTSFTIQHGIPPKLIEPQCGSTFSGNQLTISWYPATVFGNLTTKYEVQVVELLPDETNVAQAFSTAEYAGSYKYESTTTDVSFSLTASEVNLQDNFNYGFRVKAHTYTMINGNEVEVTVLANEGKTANCWFTYLDNSATVTCPVLESISGPEACEPRSTRVFWKLTDTSVEQPYQKYWVGYRPYSADTTIHFTGTIVGDDNYTLNGLTPGQTYQVAVVPVCIGALPDTIRAIFTTPSDAPTFKCGEEPVVEKPQMADLLTTLSDNDVIYIHKVPVVISGNLTSNSGLFNGEGKITFAFQPFATALPGLSVQLKNVVVDTNHKVVSGLIQSVYDPTWGGIIDLDALTQGGSLQAELLSGTIVVDKEIPGVIPDIKAIELVKSSSTPAVITVVVNYESATSTQPAQYVIPAGKTTVVIKDSNNNYYSVDVATEKVTYLGQKNPDVSALLASIDDEKYDAALKATFEQYEGDFAFDPALPTPYFSCKFYGSEYETLKPTDHTSAPYYVPWKLVPTGSTGKVWVTLPDGIDLKDYQFVTNFGVNLTPGEPEGKRYQLNLPAGQAASDYILYVIYTKSDASKVQAGQLRVRSEDPVTYAVTMVPMVSTISTSDLEADLNEMFKSYAVSWDVKIDESIAGSTAWDSKGTGIITTGDKIFSEYSEDQKALHAYYKENGEKYDASRSTVFLFSNDVVSSGGSIDNAIKLGDMPINRRWGYLFGVGSADKDKLARTLAHELGHGMLTLRHTFSDELCGNKVPQGTTANLMDYSSGAELNRFQWEAIHNPALIGKVFQDDEDGASVISYDPWVLRKYIEGYRWASINSSKLVYDGTYTIKGANINLGDGKAPYPKLNISKNKLGVLNVYPASVFDLQNRSEDRSDGLSYFTFSSDEGGLFFISVSTNRKQDLIDYLTSDIVQFKNQINAYIPILKPDDKDVLELVGALPEESQLLFDGVLKTEWISALIEERPDDYEVDILDVVDHLIEWEEKRIFLDSLTDSKCNIRYYTGHLSGDNEKDFVIKTAQFLKEVVPPDINEISRQYFNYNGDVYVKMLSWDETLGPDIIFQSDQSNYSCDIIVNTKTDWISIWQDDEYLMTLDPFEYVGIAAENYSEYLADGLVPGESVVIVPAFMLHWLLKYEERNQVLQDVTMLADMGFTLVTLGSYAVGKNVIVYGGKYATGAIVDMALQVVLEALEGNTFEEALNNIDYGQVFYSGTESLLPGWRLQAGLGCLREATIGSLDRQSFDLEEIAFNCGVGLITNVVSHGLIKKGSFLSNRLETVLNNNPGNVVKNLKSIGFDRDMVEWIGAHTGVEISNYISQYYD